MFNLIQLFKKIDTNDKEFFLNYFREYEIVEEHAKMHNKTFDTFFRDVVLSYFGIELIDSKQIRDITETIRKPRVLDSVYLMYK